MQVQIVGWLVFEYAVQWAALRVPTGASNDTSDVAVLYGGYQ